MIRYAFSIFYNGTNLRVIPSSQIIDFIKEQQAENALADIDIIAGIWQALMSLIDWNAARADQIESFAVREISVRSLSCLPPLCPS